MPGRTATTVLSLTLLVHGTLLLPGRALAQTCDDPDQAQLLWPGISTRVDASNELAQTFVVSRRGSLTRIDLLGERFAAWTPNDSLSVEIRAGLTGALLSATSVSFAFLPHERRWAQIDWRGKPAVVRPGVLYAFVVRVTASSFSIGGFPNAYSGGALYWRRRGDPWTRFEYDPDITFKIYVCEAPTPVGTTTWGVVKTLYR